MVSKTANANVPIIAATGKGDHVAGTGAHAHDVDVSADIAAAIDAHVKKDHATTTPPPIEPPPVVTPPDAKPTISSATVSSVTQTGAKVSWSLSEPCTGQVEYGPTTTYGTRSTLEPSLLPSHNQILSGLTADTTYHFRIHSIDSGGQEVISSDASFKTLAAVVVPPPVVTPPPSGLNSKPARSIADIKALLLDDTVDEIVVANGTYVVTAAAGQGANALWINKAYAGRTRAITVRPETPLGVKFDGKGTTYFGGLSFEGGVHDMTWGAFEFLNGNPTSTGVVVFGGYKDEGPGVQRITIDGMKFGPSIIGRPDATQNTNIMPQDHAVYISWSPVIGPTDIKILNIITDQPLDNRPPLYSTVNCGHGEAFNLNRVLIKGLRQTGAAVGVVLWSGSAATDPMQNLTVEDAVISGYKYTGIRLEREIKNIVLRNVRTTKDPRYPSASGLYSSLGNPPPNTTIENCSWG